MFSRSKRVRTYPTRAVGEPAGGSHTRDDLPSIVAVMDSMRELGEAVVAGDRDRYRNAYARARRLRLTSEQIYDAWRYPLRRTAVTWPAFDWQGEARNQDDRPAPLGTPGEGGVVFVVSNGDRLAICEWCGWISGRLPIGASPACQQCGGDGAA